MGVGPVRYWKPIMLCNKCKYCVQIPGRIGWFTTSPITYKCLGADDGRIIGTSQFTPNWCPNKICQGDVYEGREDGGSRK